MPQANFTNAPSSEKVKTALMICNEKHFLTNKIFRDIMEKLFDLKLWEGLLVAVASWLGMVIAPVEPFIVAVFVFVICDKVTGTRAALKRGEQKNSRAMARTIEKLVFYMIALLLSEVVRLVFMPVVPITYAVALLIIRVEFKSNSENIKQVTGVDLWPSVKQFIENLSHPKK